MIKLRPVDESSWNAVTDIPNPKDFKFLTEMDRHKLPVIAQIMKESESGSEGAQMRSEKPWDAVKQSRLIESFLVNIPVPPVILYESSYNSFEVLDGWRRLVAIRDFYDNRLTLDGLEVWPELNGRCYRQLPQAIREGIDCRSISSIAILVKSNLSPEQVLLVKRIAFERVCSGGLE